MTIPLAAAGGAGAPAPGETSGEATDVDAGSGAGVGQSLSNGREGLEPAADVRSTWVPAARTPLTRPLRIVVAAPKGGAGKTTITLGLAERLAGLRAEWVAVLDAQPLGGTAGLRVRAEGPPGPGLPGLLTSLDEVASDGSSTGWSRFGATQHDTRVTVFGRERPNDGAELEIEPYHRIVDGLANHWPLVLVDTGAVAGRQALQSDVVATADVLVVVCGPGRGTVETTAGWLREVTVPPERRVGVVNNARRPAGLIARLLAALRRTPTGAESDEARALLLSTCGRVTEIPVDDALAADAPVPLLDSARAETQDGFTELAALVMTASRHLDTKD